MMKLKEAVYTVPRRWPEAGAEKCDIQLRKAGGESAKSPLIGNALTWRPPAPVWCTIGGMIVYFLRHASAGQPVVNSREDEKRPIDKEGEKQSHDVGHLLAAMKVEVDVIISSPLTRALQTAEIVAGDSSHQNKIVTDDAMRPGATYDQFQDLLTRYRKNEAIMVVGHNPSITGFVQRLLTGNESRDWFEFKKGAIVKVEVEGRQASLQWVMTPKMARALQTASATKSRPNTSRK